MLNDTGIGRIRISIVHHRITLIVKCILQKFRFKTNRSVLQISETIIEVAVNLSRIDYLIRYGIKIVFVIEIVGFEFHLHPIQ